MEGTTPTPIDIPHAIAATAVPMPQPQEAAPISLPPQPPISGQKEEPHGNMVEVEGGGSNDALSAMKPNEGENGVKEAGEALVIGEGGDEGAGDNALVGGVEKTAGNGNNEVAGEGQGENAHAEETGDVADVPIPAGVPMETASETGEANEHGVNEHKDDDIENEKNGGTTETGAEGGVAGASGNIEDDELDAASAGRLRKIVERFGNRVQTNDVKKSLQVPKGKGTALEDMPNVASKLGRLTRNSPIVGHLHNLIFGGKAKKSELKPQLLGFSGVPDDDALEKVTSRLDGRRWPVSLMKEAMDLLEIPRGASSFNEGKNPDRGMLTARLLEWLQKPVPSGLEPPGPKKRKSVGKGKTAAAATPAKKKAKTAETPAKSKATPKATKKPSSGASSKKTSTSTPAKKASPSTAGKKPSPSGTKKSPAPAKKPSSSTKKPATGGKKAPASSKKGSTAASSKKAASNTVASKKGSPKKASPASAKKAATVKKSPTKSPKKAPAGKGSAASGKKTPSKVASKKAPAKSAKKSPLVTKKGKVAGGAASGAAKPKTAKKKKGESPTASASTLSKKVKASGDAAGGKASPKRAKPAKAKTVSKKRKAPEVEEQEEPEEYVDYRDLEDGQDDGEVMEDGPSADDLRAKVEEIIADSEDVPNLTFKMMKNQLEEHFDVPLADRKNELIDILSEAMP